MEIRILGTGCPKCHKLEAETREPSLPTPAADIEATDDLIEAARRGLDEIMRLARLDLEAEVTEGDGQLQDGEVDATSYVCGGAAGADGADGSDGVNELSYLMLEVMDEIHLLQPQANVQLSKRTSDRFLKAAAGVIRKGYGFPSVFNADAVVRELVRQGKTVEDAREGGCSGCVETGAFGKEAYILTGYLNVPKILEVTLNNGIDPVTGIHPDIDLTPVDGKRSISRRHARIRREEDGSYGVIEDVGTMNGTFVKGVRLTAGEPHPVEAGDSVIFGTIQCRFEIDPTQA